MTDALSETRKGKAKQERDFGLKCSFLTELYNARPLHFGFDSLEKLTRTEVGGWTWRFFFFFEGLVRKGVDNPERRM